MNSDGLRIHERIFAFGYILNLRWYPEASHPEITSVFGMTMSSVANVMTVIDVASFFLNDRKIVDLTAAQYMLIVGVLLIYLGVLFIGGKRYVTIIGKLERLPDESRKAVWVLGLTYHILSWLFYCGSLLLFS